MTGAATVPTHILYICIWDIQREHGMSVPVKNRRWLGAGLPGFSCLFVIYKVKFTLLRLGCSLFLLTRVQNFNLVQPCGWQLWIIWSLIKYNQTHERCVRVHIKWLGNCIGPANCIYVWLESNERCILSRNIKIESSENWFQWTQ